VRSIAPLPLPSLLLLLQPRQTVAVIMLVSRRSASCTLRGGGAAATAAARGLLDLRDAAAAASSRAFSSPREAIANSASEAPGVSGRGRRASAAGPAADVGDIAVNKARAVRGRGLDAARAAAAALQPKVRAVQDSVQVILVGGCRVIGCN